MFLQYTPEQLAFREEVRAYVRDLMSDALRQELDDSDGGGARYFEAMRRLGADRWLEVGWPKEVGGQGRGPIELTQLLNCAERLVCLLSVSGKKAFVAAISLSVRGEPQVSRWLRSPTGESRAPRSDLLASRVSCASRANKPKALSV
jgi:alkylation response protein AidB-like acyl-CoA dehydrogenase